MAPPSYAARPVACPTCGETRETRAAPRGRLRCGKCGGSFLAPAAVPLAAAVASVAPKIRRRRPAPVGTPPVSAARPEPAPLSAPLARLREFTRWYQKQGAAPSDRRPMRRKGLVKDGAQETDRS
jgi:hypothetical protein